MLALLDDHELGAALHDPPRRLDQVELARELARLSLVQGHGIHVLGGMVVWIWMLTKALKKQFGPNYFGPVDFAALYWHLVDLVWIYLFPLLYLIR